MTEKAAIYLRVSTDEQNPKNQLAQCQDFCKEKGWEIYKIYEDKGKSAYKENVIRPQFQAMLKDAEQRKFQHIVVFDLDRFSRQDEKTVLSLIKKLRLMHGVEVNAVHGDEWRDVIEMINRIPDMGIIGEALSEFLEKLIVGLQARQARRESEKISMRVKASKAFQEAKKKGIVGRKEAYIPKRVIKEILEEHPEWGYGKLSEELKKRGYNVSKSTLYRKLDLKKVKMENKGGKIK